MKKVKTFDSIYCRGKSHFEEDDTQNYIVFQLIYRYFTTIANTRYILEWKSKGLSDESIKPAVTSDNDLSPLIDTKIRLMQKAMSFNDVTIVYLKGITYKIHFWYMNKDDAVSITNSSIWVDKKGVL